MAQMTFDCELKNEMSNVRKAQLATLCYSVNCGYPKKLGLDRIEKFVKTSYAQLFRDYAEGVNNALEKNGLSATFVAQPKKGAHWVAGYENKISELNGTLYLRFYITKKTKSEIVYFENGVPCSAKRVAEIKAYEASKGKHEIGTQAALGLTADKQVKPRDITISKLHYITTNHKTIVNSDNALPIAV